MMHRCFCLCSLADDKTVWVVCADLIVVRAVVSVVQHQETMHDCHNSDILPLSCINRKLRVDDRRLLIYYMTAMNGMIGVGCLGIVCSCSLC